MYTYKNESGKPILRNCDNCKHYARFAGDVKSGLCTNSPCLFASTMKPTVYFIVRSFYLCTEHKFRNEKHLERVSERVDLQSALKAKEDR